MKLGLITWYHYRNYGTALQAAAMTAVLRQLGHEPEMIRYKPIGYFRTLPDYSPAALGKRIFRKLKNRAAASSRDWFCDDAKDQRFAEFLNGCISFTEPCANKADLEALNDRFDAFLCGSDQIWSPLEYHPRYFLDFVREPGKKIAYAPSMGVTRIEDRYIQEEIRKQLNTFGQLSIRETAGQKLIRELTGREAPVVADPTLLLTAKQWEAQFDVESRQACKPYLLVYLLGNDPDHWNAVAETANHLGLEMKIIPVFQGDLNRPGCIREAVGPREFLQLIRDAAYVCTDSFHGMIFALQFHRPFTAFARFRRGEAGNQNSRVLHLLERTGMMDRLAGKHPLAIASAPVDFGYADQTLEDLRRDSLQWLTEALASVCKEDPQKCPVLQHNSLCCGCGACKAVCPVGAITMERNEHGFWAPVVDGEKCIHCGKCTAACPFCRKPESKPGEEAKLFSFQSGDAESLQRSTSGGAAHALSKYLLSRGYSIAGCRYDMETRQARHVLIREESALAALQGSKYIQSNFADVLQELKACDGPVAVFGLPCQIAAARKVLEKRQDVVYIDLVCHGVPSGNLYRKYLEHIRRVSGMELENMQLSFRHKPSGWRTIHLHATDGIHEYHCSKAEDPFFRMFEVGNCYSESCYECRWRVDSEADIRLADYWGPRFASNNTGVSMVICFTPTGEKLARELKDLGAGTMEPQPIEDYLDCQQSCNLPKPVFYDELMQALCSDWADIQALAEKYALPLEDRSLPRKEHIRYILKRMLPKDGIF